MRFDELILPEDSFAPAPRESKPEWLLMYSRGVPVAAIAQVCRVEVRRVMRAAIGRSSATQHGLGGAG